MFTIACPNIIFGFEFALNPLEFSYKYIELYQYKVSTDAISNPEWVHKHLVWKYHCITSPWIFLPTHVWHGECTSDFPDVHYSCWHKGCQLHVEMRYNIIPVFIFRLLTWGSKQNWEKKFDASSANHTLKHYSSLPKIAMHIVMPCHYWLAYSELTIVTSSFSDKITI